LRLTADLLEFCSSELPNFNSISVGGYHMRDAGSTAVQEIGFTLAHAITYVQIAQERGIPIDQFAPRLSWIFCVSNNFLEEIAKFRALRRMWARIMKDQFGAKNPKSWALRAHVQTAGSSLTAQQPENNIVRSTIQALAAALGGVQSMAVSCFDEAYALPTEHAQKISVRTQQVIAFESGVADTVDPLGGSYYIENLTNELEKGAQEYLDRIEDMGGAISAIESGYIQHEIQEASYAYQKAIDDGQKVIVGVNRFVEEGEQPAMLFRPDPASEKAQIESLKKVRAGRDDAAVKASLAALVEACRNDEGLIDPIVEAVKTYASVGEISDAMRSVFGEYTPATAV
jgi:methylmalonyl-CoA mutase N-terminal domain/subunit